MSIRDREEKSSFGTRLKELRKGLDMSQEVLGARLATTGRTIKKYEANETSMRVTELMALGNLGADVLYLVTGRHEPVDLEHPATPAQRLAAAVAALELSDDDADLIAAMARRLASR